MADAFTARVTKSGHTPLVWRDRVESVTPQLSEGNICVLASERCSLGGRAIACLQPSEVTVPVTVQVRSTIETEAKGRERGVIPVSNPAAETERESPAFYAL